MREVSVIGAGMVKFGKYLNTSMKTIGRDAVNNALTSAGVGLKQIEAAAVGNAMAGLVTGQECVRGQVVLREMGFGGIPIINCENACASSSTAFHLAWLYVASGMYDIVLALGMEKLYHADKRISYGAIGSAVDVELAKQIVAEMNAQQEKLRAERAAKGEAPKAPAGGAGESRSMFMDFYAAGARAHMKKYGTTREQFGRVAVKNHRNGSLNPHAQYQEVYSLEDVLNSPMVADPLTRLMCSPIGDGAAAAVLCASSVAPRYTNKPVRVLASLLSSGSDHGPDDPGIVERVSRQAYEKAGLGPKDISVIELHDASAPAELMAYEELGLCGKGEGGRLIDDGSTEITGRIPVNPSGGLLAKGHPVGATGVAQISEIFWQLRGEADKRQVKNPKIGLTENAGGSVHGDAAAMSIHILGV
ncbi:MAG TPA: thiolase family protein [Acidimicrobiales bacterium]|nr:thiolase family protein [Acidimicrobiales bacterium]HYB91747.1 thiolase family protein [Candidatus Binataceae bacterium]